MPKKRFRIFTLVGVVDDIHWVRLAAITDAYPAFVGSGAIAYTDTPILYDLFVHEDYRRTGIARELLRAAKKWADQINKNLYLELNPSNPVTQLYEKEGFGYTGETTEDGKLWMVYCFDNKQT